MKAKARVIAMYLPQYYPIPENDKVWGKGFTEWTNVGRAKPLFRGHYQPRVPADLGYYDLRLPIIREQQAALAREAGVEGFMYWHYWFGNGQTVLSEVFNEVLESGKPNFPFCLGWANHSWRTDHWQDATTNKKKQTFIFEQKYPGREDYEMHFNALLPAFKDNRYIKVDGKPLFYIWNPFGIPDIGAFINLWRDMALKNGLNGIHFVGLADGKLENYTKVLEYGLDALAPGNMWRAEASIKGYWLKVVKKIISKHFPRIAPLDRYKYKSIINNFYTELDKRENCYPSIIPNWDRSPRNGRRAVIYTGSTPDLFKQHVEEAVRLVSHKEPEHRIIFLRSWNEWAEGNYMEPDLRFGHGYLNALREVLIKQ